ncbi:MAG: four helix bundle protein [Saprospiraceae bacterium]
MNENKNILKNKSFAFAISCVKIFKHLTDTKKEFVLSKQLLRSGTSIGANIREAHNAESKADFIHKFGIAQKECDETIYWLELLHHSEYLNQGEFESHCKDATEVLKMIRSSILTLKQKMKS